MEIGKLVLYSVLIVIIAAPAGAGIAVAALGWDKGDGQDDDDDAKKLNWVIEFYLSLIAYFVLHLLIVTSSDFVEAFDIPPLNIGIYVDKLAAIRALLMVLADLLEYGFLDKVAGGSDQGRMKKRLSKDPGNPRRLGSIVSFVGMLVCRILYLWIVYKSDNKSLYVFIVLCIEGFWFGVFQMSFFAIGPQYNAVTSLGIHTMGNFIFFGQLVMQRQAKSRPEINCLYRVRVHAKTCVITSVSALIAWIGFCIGASGKGDSTALGTYYSTSSLDNSDFKVNIKGKAVWSPFLLFIVGAFAEDFAVPGILPFALLDNDKAALVNYCTPLFFMSGALVTVLLDDVFTGQNLGFKLNTSGSPWMDWGFKKWSVYWPGSNTTANVDQGRWWNFLWLMNLPKYIAFFIAMWCIHGTYPELRCIVQSRWRVMLLTMLVVIPRATLETAGYVGVANYANGATATGWSVYDEFVWIAYHDMLAMFCRFVYGKFAVGYNCT